MKKVFAAVIVICIMFVITSCSGGEPSKTPESENPSTAEGDSVAETQGTPANSGLVGCGQIFSTGGLSYNIIGLRKEVFEDSEMLLLKMEIRNDGAENKNYETLSTLELYDEKGELCDNEVFARVESELHGNILPGGRLVGEVAFNITDRAGGGYALHIGEFYEYSPAIAIKESDVGMTFAEQFGKSTPDITYSNFLESDELTIKINDISTVVDNDGQKLLLIDISVTNNGSESTDLFDGFYLDGVYAKSGSKLNKSLGRYWDYLNYAIEPGDTKDGVLAYKIEDGNNEFYMIVAPDSSNYSQKFTLGFTAKENTPNVEQETTPVTTDGEQEQEKDSDFSGVFKNGVIAMEYSMFGMTASSVTYYRGEDYRTVIESDTTDMPIIMIYLKSEDATYRFNEESSKGDKIVDTFDGDIDFMQEGVSLYAAVLEAKSEGEPITITDETLDGEPVKYIHGTYTDEEEGGTATVEMWYSEKYNLPLKYEISSGGMSVMALTVTDIKVDNSLANDLFVPPSDVEFTEFDSGGYIDDFLEYDYSSIDKDRDMSDFGPVKSMRILEIRFATFS